MDKIGFILWAGIKQKVIFLNRFLGYLKAKLKATLTKQMNFNTKIYII